MEKILISACLAGERCRYDGKNNYNPLIKELLQKYELVPFCPEVEGGLSIPRDPSERKRDLVVSKTGHNVTRQFAKGAELALNICRYLGIHITILKENSPSCGVNQIYDGSFSNRLIPGSGMTAELLKRKGIRVISENDIEAFLQETR
ncbi:MAG TPA: DUF523 domain-containing protein [Bacilli bacterium]|nr:DUF523 domain-containing protein [Bacilli bacterium]HPS18981.1 DUF523 domain-containing protein [Bacilli bacterium]